MGLLFAGETWTMTAADYDRLDAFDSQCLRKILGIRWQDFVTNVEGRRTTQEPLQAFVIKLDLESSSLVSVWPHLAFATYLGYADGPC